MSDLRLEDLVVPNPNIEGDYYPVTRIEVLEALGAERWWRCHIDGTLSAVQDCDPDSERTIRSGSRCGWVTVTAIGDDDV